MYHTRAHCRVEANGSEGNFENDRIQPQSIRSGNGISGQATLSDGANGLVNTRAQVSRKDEARKTEEPRAGEVNDEIQITVHLDDKFLPNISGRTAHAQWPFPKDLSNPHIPEGGTHNIVFSSDSSGVYVSSCPRRLGTEIRAIDGCTALVLNDRQDRMPLRLHARAAFALPPLDNLGSPLAISSHHYDPGYFGGHPDLITPTPVHTRDMRQGQESVSLRPRLGLCCATPNLIRSYNYWTSLCIIIPERRLLFQPTEVFLPHRPSQAHHSILLMLLVGSFLNNVQRRDGHQSLQLRKRPCHALIVFRLRWIYWSFFYILSRGTDCSAIAFKLPNKYSVAVVYPCAVPGWKSSSVNKPHYDDGTTLSTS
ncbi:hypothetical protein BDN71DRAFT_1223518 [Pleurotus eryngii]|uniref:Uncharacterized protein n=1 Tax=Pleurotus eryngii TaxID=5323 RepID=A0A9P6DDQ7_PLEER|nr:hypothetical protein BDN71DRAFT_1223518 [Pleurotus eryngii]